ncbi:hypothetical protein DFH07DRAFT_951644 [Mycena maculata]|uniref:Endo-polygalacturonase n=1 Tax=Mycena maculata TaxID=230809 RepID=A0AAD7K200_9AGAR|nr:hypothetical protein DFH07DRAFT_951644 [Mycena maculata]
MTGDITFAQTMGRGWPLITFDTASIVFNGRDHTINVNIHFNCRNLVRGMGSFTGMVKPRQSLSESVGTNAAAVVSGITVNNAGGNTKSLGANTDEFAVEGDNITILDSTVNNQDDCVGRDGATQLVMNVKIGNNTITGGLYRLRIKVDADITDASISNILYDGNHHLGEYGVLITLSYPDNDGIPGTDA